MDSVSHVRGAEDKWQRPKLVPFDPFVRHSLRIQSFPKMCSLPIITITLRIKFQCMNFGRHSDCKKWKASVDKKRRDQCGHSLLDSSRLSGKLMKLDLKVNRYVWGPFFKQMFLKLSELTRSP